MQRFKSRFSCPDGSRLSTLQSCVRTNDLDLVGDGTHLTYFEMLGNFSFGNNDYQESVKLWEGIVRDLNLPITSVHVHPDREDHWMMWQDLYDVVPDESCVWSDGDIGGHCCELYCGDLEVGNLVNTLGHSTDVGFGFERICQVVEGKSKVHETSLFRQDVDPVTSDHIRCVESLLSNGIMPGIKSRSFICRRLIRRILDTVPKGLPFDDVIESERKIRDGRIKECRRLLRKHSDKSDEWWWSTLGVLPEERKRL
jgi:alanyl-tRNA synthetase